MDIQIHNDLNSILQIYQNIKIQILKNTAWGQIWTSSQGDVIEHLLYRGGRCHMR